MRIRLSLLFLGLLMLPVILLAQERERPTLPPDLDLSTTAGKIVLIAFLVFLITDGLKDQLSWLTGTPAKIFALLMSVAGAILATGPENLLSLEFVVTLIGILLSAFGINRAAKKLSTG